MYTDLKTVDNHGNSVLHIAAQNGRAGIIEDLILNGADVNYGTVQLSMSLPNNSNHQIYQYFLIVKSKTFPENWDSKVPSVGTLFAYLETTA